MAVGVGVVLVSLVMLGCAGEENPFGPNGALDPAPDSMSATINGWAWEADLIYTTYVTPTGERLLTINGGNEAQWDVIVSIRFEGPGTYTVGGVRGANMFVGDNAVGRVWVTHGYWGLAEPPIPGTSGTVTVTTMTANRAVGTFTFVAVGDRDSGARGTMRVTDGRFDVTF